MLSDRISYTSLLPHEQRRRFLTRPLAIFCFILISSTLLLSLIKLEPWASHKPDELYRTPGYAGPAPVTCSPLSDEERRLDEALLALQAGREGEWNTAIWQSAREHRPSEARMSWIEQSPGWQYELLLDDPASAWINSSMPQELVEVYASLPKPVMKADLLRYALLWAQGGVWADIDTVLLKPVDKWTRLDLEDADLLVGIEMDHALNLDPRWRQYGWAAQDRGYDLVQWTMRARRFSPALRRTLVKLASRARAHGSRTPSEIDILRVTGPVVFTDAVLETMACELGHAVSWLDLGGLKKPKQIANVVVLPVSAFNGVDEDPPDSRLVAHQFASSWKSSWWFW